RWRDREYLPCRRGGRGGCYSAHVVALHLLALGRPGMRRLGVLVSPDNALVAVAGEEGPAPVHKGSDFFFRPVEQSEVDAEPRQPGNVSSKCATPGELHHAGAAGNLTHGPLVVVLERLWLLARHQPFDRIADVPASLQGDGA